MYQKSRIESLSFITSLGCNLQCDYCVIHKAKMRDAKRAATIQQKIIESLKEQLEMFKDKYYRSIADMDNQRKIYDKEYRSALKYAAQDLAESLIPSFEMFSMVVESVDNLPPEVAPYVQGFSMIYRQMIGALESQGVKEILVKVGDEFDHKLHAAMETQEVEDLSLVNKVTKVVRKGYVIHDRLIKPATVIVGKAKEEVKEENNESKADA